MHNKLYILWTSDNEITAERMVFMYAHNAIVKGWWEEVTVIIWGASAELTAKNTNIQESLQSMQEDGVKISACRACAEQLEVVEDLENLGFEVKHWGIGLTEILKSGEKIITI